MSKVRQFPNDAAPDFRLQPLAGVIRQALFASAGALLVQGATLEQAHAGPQGGNVAAGQGQINKPNATTTVVQQQSQSLVVNWQTFDVAKNELVQFNQPSVSASVLNRVLNQTPSQIFGSVKANGKVFLLNPSGVVIGKSARVNVGSLFMSSLHIGDDDFMNGKYQFAKKDGSPAGAIINRGLIQAATGGSVTLVGEQVSNEGVIVADAGHVNLAAGRTATVDFNGDGLIRFEVDGEVVENASGAGAAVTNSGEIHADGGQVLLTASTASQVFDRAVNNSGLIRAGSIQKVGGKVTLSGFGGGVVNTGTVDSSGTSGGEVRMVSDAVVEQFGTARADGSTGDGGRVHLASVDTTTVGGESLTSVRSDTGTGGLIEVLGDKVGLVGNARIDAAGATGGGTVLVGGDYQGANPAVRNATSTEIAAGVSVSADAVVEGDGGTVIVWSDSVTQHFGAISARGGAAGGDGGFVETSAKGVLDVSGSVDTGASSGQAGVWLLDPINVTIQTAGAHTVNSAGETVDDQSVIDAASIVDALDGGNTVTIRTNGADIGGEAGNITVASGLDAMDLAGNTGTLNLEADNDIIINDNIAASNGVLVLTLVADLDSNEGGTAVNGATGGDVDINADITTNGGDLTSSGVAFDNTGGIINLGLGALDLIHDGVVTVGANVTAGSVAIDTLSSVTVATGVTVATSDNAAGDSGSIVIGTDAATRIGGGLTLTGTAELRTGTAAATDVAIVESGSISVFATGAIDGTGTMVTGTATGTDTAADATDVDAFSGDIVVDSSANVAEISATTGAADIDSTTDTDAAATSGTVTLTGLGIGTTTAAAVAIGVANDANADTNETQGTLSLTSTGADGAGDITASMTTALDLGTVSNVAVTTAGTTQTIDLTAPSVTLAAGGFSVGTDNLILRATAGAIDDGTAGTGGNALTAAILALSAVTDIDVSTVTGSIAATSTGAGNTIFVENTGALNVNDAADALGLTAGDAIVSSNGDITVTATGGSLTVIEDIAAGAGSVGLTTTGGTSHILGAGGTVSTSDGGTGLVLNTGGGVGVGGALNTALGGTGLLSITTAGATADGNVTIIEADALSVANVTLNTAASAQSISLTASTGDVTLGAANIGDAADDLTLVSTAGEVVGGAGVATANVLVLSAATGIGASAALTTAAQSIGAATTAGNIDIDNALGTTTTITALTTAGASTISFDQTGAGGLSLAGDVTTGTGTATLTTASGAINRASGTITADTVSLSAASGIGDTGALSTATGSIGATTTTGAIDIDNALGTATTVTALTTAAGAINFDQTGAGGVLLNGAVTTDAASTATLASAADINRTSGTITAGTVDLMAASGVGNTGALSTATEAIGVATTAGVIDIDNAFGTTTTLTALTTSGANAINFDQTGAGGLSLAGDVTTGAATATLTTASDAINRASGTITADTVSLTAASGIGDGSALSTATGSIGATTTTGAIDIDNALGTVTTVTALTTAAGAINFDQTGAGGLALNGAVTTDAASTATLTSAADINRTSGTITAGTVDLMAVSGIGNTGALDTAAGAVSAVTTAGNIDIDNAFATTTTVSALTTSTAGTINFDQTGLGDVSFATVTTDGAGTVTLHAQSGLTLTGTLSTGSGDVSLNADSDNADTGGGELGALNFGGGTVTTTGAVALTAFTFGTTGTITASPTSLALNFTRGGDLTLGDDAGGGPSLSDAAMDIFTTTGGGTLVLSTGGGIVLDRATAANGNLSLTAGTTIAGNATGVAWENATGTLILNAGTGIGTLSTAAESIGATTTAGNIDIDNALGATTTITALSTVGAGTINFDQTGAGGVSLAGDVTTGTGTATLTTASGAINRASGTITADTVSLSAASGIGDTGALSTATGSIGATTTTGAIDIDNALGTATTVTALTTAAGAINFDQTGAGGVALNGAVTTDAASTATLTSAVDINRTSGTITAGTVDLMAASGIGNTSALSTATEIIGAVTTAGVIDIDNAFGTTTTLTALTTSGANAINFDQTGAGGLSLGGDVTTGAATATLTTASGGINRASGTITADTVSLTAASGIGDTGALSTATGSIGATTTTGAIDIDNALGTVTTVTALTTAAGAINFDQTGAGGVLLNGAVTTDAASTATLTSAADIARISGTITAGTVDLSAASGIAANTDTAVLSAVNGAAGGNVAIIDASGVQINALGNAATGGTLSLTSAGAIDLNSNITTAGGSIALDAGGNALTLLTNVLIDTTNGEAAPLGGDINFAAGTTIDGDASGTRSLDLSAGDNGTVTIASDVGGINPLLSFTVRGGPGTSAATDRASQADLQAVTTNGGDITVVANTINANGALTTQGASGGTLTIDGGGITLGAGPVVGADNITLRGNGGADQDLIITAALTSATTINLSATRDIIVQNLIDTSGGAAANIILIADSDLVGNGGVLVDAAGELRAGNDITLTGSALNSALVAAATGDSVAVATGGNVNSGRNAGSGGGNILLTAGANAPVTADIFVQGAVSTAVTTTGGSITMNSARDIRLGSTAIATEGGAVAFQDNVGLDAATTITSNGAGGVANVTFAGTVNGASDLVVNSSGITTFAGAVTTSSLTTDAGGSTAINAGGTAVTTSGSQTYNDAVTFAAASTLTSGGDLVLAAGGTSTAGDLTLIADGAFTLGGALAAAGRIVTLDTNSASTAFIGADNATGLGLSDAEIGLITSSLIRVGQLAGPTNNTVNLNGDIVAAGKTLAVRTTGAGGALTGTPGITLDGFGLQVTTTPQTIFLQNVANAVSNIALDTGGADITFRQPGSITVGTVDGIVGVNATNANDVDLGSLNGSIGQAGGALVIADQLTTISTGGVGFGAEANQVASFNATNTGGGTIALNDTAGDLDITGIAADGANVTLATAGDSAADDSLTQSGAITAATALNAVATIGNVNLAGANVVASFSGSAANGNAVFNNASPTLALGPLTAAAVSVTNSGAITSAGTVTSTGALNLNAGGALAATTVTGSTLSLTSAGNIVVNDNGFSTSQLTINPGGARVVTLGGPAVVDSAAIAGVDADDSVILTGAATVTSNVATGGYNLAFTNAAAVTLGAAVSSISAGTGELGFANAVSSPAGALTLTAATTNFGGDIAMGAGSPLTIASDLNLISKTQLTTDALNLGGAVTGADLTILRTTSADAEIGGSDPIFNQANLDQFAGYSGTLSLGGERTVVPGSSANLLGNVEVTGLLKTAGDIFLAGAGDINFDNSAPGVGRVESTKSDGVVSIAALGTATVDESGNITDTGVFNSFANPGRVAVAVGSSGTIELLANNQIGSETGGGAEFNLSAPTLSVAQVAEGEAQVDNAVFGAANTESVQEILAAYSAPGSAISSFIGTGLNGAVLQNLIQTPSSTPKQEKGELGFIDEGVFLLPSTFTNPERAVLMPILGDPDFPGDQRPEDPDADDEWLAFFEDVVREYIASRYVLAEEATSEERAAVEAIVTSELQAIIAFYEAVRERERTQLAAAQFDAEQREADSNSDAEQQPDANESDAPVQQGALPVEGQTLGHIGRPWSAGGIGFEIRG